MKTRKELCESAGIIESTFTFYRLKGLLPEATGLRGRQAVWEDSTLETLAFIKDRQKDGMTLEQIKDALPGFYLLKAQQAEAHAKFLEMWLDVDQAREDLAEIIGIDLAGADILLNHTARAYVTAIDGPTVTLADVDRVNKIIVDTAVISLADYLEIEFAAIRSFASKNQVRVGHANMAHRVFTQGEDIKELVASARKLNQLSAKLHM